MEASVQSLQAILFSESQDETQTNTYAVLDGAAIPDLLDQLYGDEPPEFVCLYSGDLEPDMAECAPYLVELKPETAFTTWLLSESRGKHWGIFALSSADLKAMRKQCRAFLKVKDERGESLYFRYYDPRVLRSFLPIAEPQQLQIIFGPVQAYFVQSEEPGGVKQFSLEQGELREVSALQARVP